MSPKTERKPAERQASDPELLRYAALSRIFAKMADDGERHRAVAWVVSKFGHKAHQTAPNGSGQPISPPTGS